GESVTSEPLKTAVQRQTRWHEDANDCTLHASRNSSCQRTADRGCARAELLCSVWRSQCSGSNGVLLGCGEDCGATSTRGCAADPSSVPNASRTELGVRTGLWALLATSRFHRGSGGRRRDCGCRSRGTGWRRPVGVRGSSYSRNG